MVCQIMSHPLFHLFFFSSSHIIINENSRLIHGNSTKKKTSPKIHQLIGLGEWLPPFGRAGVGHSLEFYYKYIYNSYKLRTIIPAPLTRESQGRFSFPVIALLPSPFHRFLELRPAMCRLFSVFPPSFSTFSTVFLHFFRRFFSTIPMESFSNVNGIVEQIQWNRSTKSMALLPETVSFIVPNPHFCSRNLPFSLAKAVCKQRHRLCLLPVKQAFLRLQYVPAESTKKKTWKTLFL